MDISNFTSLRLDPMRIQAIINKKPQDVVTYLDWNEILQLLVTQADALAQSMAGLNQTMDDLLSGNIPNIEVNTNVTSFGGQTIDWFASKAYSDAGDTSVRNFVTTELAKKQNTLSITPLRVLISGADRSVAAADITRDQLNQLGGIRSNIQSQIDGKLNSSTNNKLFISRTMPSGASVGDVWVSW